MRFQYSLLLVLANYCCAAKYSIDPSCRSDDALFNGVRGAVQEGIDLADNALTVMTDHGNNQWVRKMARYILGAVNFDQKFSHAMSTFRAVKGYERDPSQSLPRDPAWRTTRTNRDVEIYCGDSRFTKNPEKLGLFDGAMENNYISAGDRRTIESCYKPDHEIGTGDFLVKAITKSSNAFDRVAYHAAKATNENVLAKDFRVAKLNIACTMDICTWFSSWAAREGWPIITSERVARCKTDEFKAGLYEGLTPIDGLKTIGSTVLHELTHTIQGGQLIDIHADERPPGVTSCYNWICIGGLASERNADSIAMLGIAMKLWSLNHYAEDDGSIHPIP